MNEIFLMKPCKGTPACAVHLKKHAKIDLGRAAKKFEKVLANTPVILVVVFKGVSVTIYPSGKLLIKSRDEQTVRGIAEKVYKLLL